MADFFRITIRKVYVKSTDPFTEFCKLTGLANEYDKNETAIKILIALKKYHNLNATELSRIINMSRGAVLHQLENLIERGFIFRYGKNYYLREENFEKLVEEWEKDVKKTFEKLKSYAKQIDNMLSD